MKNLLFIMAVLLATSCATTSQETAPNEHIYWVNSLQADCVGVGPKLCLQIQKGEVKRPGKWELFYSSIKGFDFEPGYIYKLAVTEDQVPADQVPADASSINYTLVKVIEKQKDPTIAIHGNWSLETMDEEEIDLGFGQGRPQMDINLTTQKTTGTDGCNNFFGDIKTVENGQLVFGPIASTRKACKDMEISIKFTQKLDSIASYNFQDEQLHLFNEDGKELMGFEKAK